MSETRQKEQDLLFLSENWDDYILLQALGDECMDSFMHRSIVLIEFLNGEIDCLENGTEKIEPIETVTEASDKHCEDAEKYWALRHYLEELRFRLDGVRC